MPKVQGPTLLHACLTPGCILILESVLKKLSTTPPNVQDAEAAGADALVLELVRHARLRGNKHIAAAGRHPQLRIRRPPHVLQPPRNWPAEHKPSEE